jgi:hypothetical protein
MHATARAACALAALSVLGSTSAAGCARSPSRPTEATLGQPFELRTGATVVLEGGLTLLFDRVGSDSRCPADAQCVWAGDAVVQISTRRASDRADRELHTGSGASAATVFDYTVKLLQLVPQPRTDRTIEPEEYIATLLVTRR